MGAQSSKRFKESLKILGNKTHDFWSPGKLKIITIPDLQKDLKIVGKFSISGFIEGPKIHDLKKLHFCSLKRLQKSMVSGPLGGFKKSMNSGL